MLENQSFRSSALERWALSYHGRFLSRAFVAKADEDMQQVVREEWDFAAKVLSRALSVLMHSLPHSDLLRVRAREGKATAVEELMDVFPPTMTDLETDLDYAPLTDVREHADMLRRAESAVIRLEQWLVKLEEDQRAKTLAEIGDTYRILLARRAMYVMDRDDHALGVIPLWTSTMERLERGENPSVQLLDQFESELEIVELPY